MLLKTVSINLGTNSEPCFNLVHSSRFSWLLLGQLSQANISLEKFKKGDWFILGLADLVIYMNLEDLDTGMALDMLIMDMLIPALEL